MRRGHAGRRGDGEPLKRPHERRGDGDDEAVADGAGQPADGEHRSDVEGLERQGVVAGGVEHREERDAGQTEGEQQWPR